MGLGNWLARKGNVGGTARAVAKGWKFFKSQNPEMSDKELAEAYVYFRYGNTGEMELAVRALSLLEKFELFRFLFGCYIFEGMVISF